jgi:hypothetical protein
MLWKQSTKPKSRRISSRSQHSSMMVGRNPSCLFLRHQRVSQASAHCIGVRLLVEVALRALTLGAPQSQPPTFLRSRYRVSGGARRANGAKEAGTHLTDVAPHISCTPSRYSLYCASNSAYEPPTSGVERSPWESPRRTVRETGAVRAGST